MRWTQDEIDTSIQLAAAGKNSVQIAAQLNASYNTNRTPGSVLLCLRRNDQEAHQLREDARRLRHDGLRSLAVKMANKGVPANTIAEALGVHVRTIERAVPSEQRVGASRQSPFQVWLEAQPGYKPYKEPPVTATGKSFADKGDDECSWWIGDDSEGKARFCAAPRDKTRSACSYCTMHYAASIIPGDEA